MSRSHHCHDARSSFRALVIALVLLPAALSAADPDDTGGEMEEAGDVPPEQVLEDIDTDGDGKVSFQEVLAELGAGDDPDESELKEVTNYFKKADSDGDELLNVDELHTLIKFLSPVDDEDL
mmetsp:Transcript_57521/g.168456  ORF Transcript_57521/g.168456 Transcript_57521/m.168456 type:complete len:122 (-) Transcript_57521:264-629(-)